MGSGAKTGRWNKFAHLYITKAIKSQLPASHRRAILFHPTKGKNLTPARATSELFGSNQFTRAQNWKIRSRAD
jgi:hypothetical protein